MSEASSSSFLSLAPALQQELIQMLVDPQRTERFMARLVDVLNERFGDRKAQLRQQFQPLVPILEQILGTDLPSFKQRPLSEFLPAFLKGIQDPLHAQVLQSYFLGLLPLMEIVFAPFEEVLLEQAHTTGAHYSSPLSPTTLQTEGHYTVPNQLVYQFLRYGLMLSLFRVLPEHAWPTARLGPPSKPNEVHGHAQLKPPLLDQQPALPPEQFQQLQASMRARCAQLSDFTVDVLDALCCKFLAVAGGPNERFVIWIDEIPMLRGLQKKRSGTARRGGFEPEQRQQVLTAIATLLDVYLEASLPHRSGKTQQLLQTRLFVIVDRLLTTRADGAREITALVLTPGTGFGQLLWKDRRQNALLAAHALRYEPVRQKWEKRLTRYLSSQRRIRASTGKYEQPFRVETLLNGIGEGEENPRWPQRTKDRLEKALEQLQQDRVLAAWQYVRWEDARGASRGWWADWLQTTIRIEPPDVVVEHYESIRRSAADHKTRTPRRRAPNDLSAALKAQRQARGLSIARAAEQVGVSAAEWRAWEQGTTAPTAAQQKHLQAWHSQTPAADETA